VQRFFCILSIFAFIFLLVPASIKADETNNGVGAGAKSGVNPNLPPGCAQTGSGDNISFSCNTGLGIKITSNPQGFTKSLFGIILSMSGAVAILLIIISGYRLMMSGGNPEKVKGAKEQLTSAIVGLLFIIFSIVILQIIGVDILMIPGFT